MKKNNKKEPAIKKKKVPKKKVAPKRTTSTQKSKKTVKKTKIYPPSSAVMKRVSKKAKLIIKDSTKPKKTVNSKLGSAFIEPLNPRVVTEEAINVSVEPPVAPKKVPGKRPTSTSSVRNYLSKKELLGAVMESKALGKMSDDLAFKLQLLTDKYARSAQYARYTFNDDMRAYALMMLVRTWNSFNPEKSDNPFAFYTQCIKNSFIQYLNQEKRQRNIRDELLVDQGLTPSYTYQMEYEGSQPSDERSPEPEPSNAHGDEDDTKDDHHY